MKKQQTYKNYIAHYKMDADYHDYFNLGQQFDIEVYRRYQEFFTYGSPRENDFILEIGSGSGMAARLLKSLPVNYIPVDIPQNNLYRIKNQINSKVLPVSGDGYALPFNKDVFDKVIISEVLEHLENPEIVLAEIFRVLKPKGVLCISVPYKEIITYHICIHCNKPTPSHAHLHSYDRKKLVRLIESVDFKLVRVSQHMNKAANRLYLTKLLGRAPFRFWKTIDTFFNLIIPKPAKIILIAHK